MAEREDRMRLQVKVNPDVAAKVDELAKRLKMDRQDFLERLIEVALGDNEWLIKLVTAEFMEPVRDLVNVWERQGKRQSKGGTAGA